MNVLPDDICVYIYIYIYIYLTIILRGRAGYRMIDNQRGA